MPTDELALKRLKRLKVRYENTRQHRNNGAIGLCLRMRMENEAAGQYIPACEAEIDRLRRELARFTEPNI